MLSFSKTVAAAVVAGCLMMPAATASALTVNFVGGDGGNTGTAITGTGFVSQNNLANGTANIDFGWLDTSPAYLAYSEFTASTSFKLTFQDYAPESDLVGGTGARSGFQLFRGSFADGPAGLTAMIPQTPVGETPCGADVLANFGSTDCVLVTGAGNVGTTFVVPASVFGPFSGSTSFVLMFSEGNNPNNGSAEFLISAVPLPAGGLLLLTALGGVAALRRRRKAA
jgi:hypothetical protein